MGRVTTLCLLASLLCAAQAGAQGNPTGTGLRPCDRSGRRRHTRGHRDRRFPQPPGRRAVTTNAVGDYIIPFLPPGQSHADVRAAGFPAGGAEDPRHVGRNGHARRKTADRRRRRGDHRDRQRCRRVRPRGECGDHLQAGTDQRPAAQSWHRGDDGIDAGGAAHRAQRRRDPGAVDLRRHFVGKPGARQRRRGPGQRSPERPAGLHRGLAAGNDGHDVRRLRGVRTVQRRRDQRDHQVGRQPLRRHVPHQPGQRHVARADTLSGDTTSDTIVPVYGTRSAARCCATGCGSSPPAVTRTRRSPINCSVRC